MPPSSRARALLFRMAPTVLLVVMLLAIEGAVRLLLPPVPALDVMVGAPDQLLQLVGRQDTDARRARPRIFEADPLLFWRLRPNVPPTVWNQTLVSTNAQGLRHPGPIERKRPGGTRIVCLGDSVTFGFRVPLATVEHPQPGPGAPYPRVLEELLRAKGHEVEVVAMAVPGYSSHQGRAWARRDLAALEPDVVVACFGWNDVSTMPRADVSSMPTGPARVWARTVLMHSQAALHAYRAMRSGGAGAGASTLVPRVSRDDYVANLRAIAATARGRGASILVVGPVYRDATTVPDEAARMTTYRRDLAAALGADGTAYLEIPELTEVGAPGNADLFVEHIHPNEAGHRRLAEAIAHALIDRGLLSHR